MTPIIAIREAELQDAPQLLPLLQQLGYPQSLKDLKNRLHCYQKSQNHFVFVAELHNKIVGFISLVSTESFVYQGRVYRVTALAVDENMRRKGVGRALLKYSEDLARNTQGKFIELTSGVRREPEGSHHFYNVLGYENKGESAKLYLRKKL